MKFYGTRLATALAFAVLTSVAAGAATKCSSGDRMVTVNVKTKTYYVHSNRSVRMNQSSTMMCEKKARAAGYRMAIRNTHKRAMRRPAMNGPLPSASPTIQTNPNNEQNGIQTTPTPNPQPTH